MENAIKNAAILAGDFSNAEYIRGMCELLSIIYPESDVMPDERSEWFWAQIRQAAGMI